MGIPTCADGTDQKNLQALVDNGAQIVYGPHANTTGGTTAGWYKFRAAWGGPNGWIAQLRFRLSCACTIRDNLGRPGANVREESSDSRAAERRRDWP
jgi:hypothetical protein